MALSPCPVCGRGIPSTAPQCPHCGALHGDFAEELARLERAIAEMKARDAELAQEQQALAAELQAAIFQRDVLAHAQAERLKRGPRPRTLRHRIGRRPPTATGHIPPPRQPPPEEGPVGTASSSEPPPPAPPETSSKEIQNVLLGLSALVLAAAAVVFAGFAVSTLALVSRMLILGAAIALTLAAAPVLARRSLISTAETVAGIGLLLIPLAGYSLLNARAIDPTGFGGGIIGALIFAATALVAGGYAQVVPLTVPRVATVLAVQPVLPLIISGRVDGPVGWALALTAVGVLDLCLAWLFAHHRAPRWLLDPSSGRDTAPRSQPTSPEERPRTNGRPEGAPEEPDAVVIPEQPEGAPDTPATATWLRDLIWALHGLAIGAALAYAAIGLLRADAVLPATRAGVALVLAAAVGVVGAVALGRRPLPDVATGLFTLAVIGAVSRVATLAFPEGALLVVALIVAGAGAGVRALPEAVRRGPQVATGATLAVLGILVAGSAVRATVAPIRAAQPIWTADLTTYAETIAATVGAIDWQLATAALLLAMAAALALPAGSRRGAVLAGLALAAVAAPASFRLAWFSAPWPAILVAIGIGLAGLTARTERSGHLHAAGAALVGTVGALTATARPSLTAAALATLAAGGALVALLARRPELHAYPGSDTVASWAEGGAALALPGAVAALTATWTASPPTAAALNAATVPILATSFLAVGAALGYAAIRLVSERLISTPLTLGTGLGALLVAGAAFGAPGATGPDAVVGALVLVSAVLLFLAPTIDAGRRADRLFDGADYAAAAATVALAGALARVGAVIAPGFALTASAALMLVVAAGVRALPVDWQRGPILGAAVSGGAIALIAGYQALGNGLLALATPGGLWHADLDAWPSGPAAWGWQVPAALALLAGAAAVALPRPWSHTASGALAVLATVGTPVALGLPWWSPILVGCTVATVYALAGVAATDPRSGLARSTVAAAVLLYTIGAALVRPWTTAATLILVALLGVVIAVLAQAVATLTTPPPEPDAAEESEETRSTQDTSGILMPPHLARIGGVATAAALLALPGAVASVAAHLAMPPGMVLTSALAAAGVGLVGVAAVRRHVPHYLPYATAGLTGGTTLITLAALPTDLPAALYAATAVLLVVLAELLRAHTPAPRAVTPIDQSSGPAPRWTIPPERGVVLAAALPTALATVAIAPTLLTALIAPYGTLRHPWHGPPTALLAPPAIAVDPTTVGACALLTLAAALAAIGFTGGRLSEAIPVILPGLAVTLLIAPIALDLPWPASTVTALAVFTLTMLGLALTPPPPDTARARPIRIARVVVFAIGLAAGGAGLAGSLATSGLTVMALGGGVTVGAVAALVGSSSTARILGWLFGAVMAQLFVLTTGLVAGAPATWSAFGVLAVGALLLLSATQLPRVRGTQGVREATVVEWTGYGAALLALALAHTSLRHVAGLLAAWGAVLGVVSTRPDRALLQRRVLFWAAVGCEIVAWWLLMALSGVRLLEAYTLPFAALALLVGMVELRHRPDLTSWTAYGPALVAAFAPTLILVVASGRSDLRQVFLLLGAVATLLLGSMRQQQAPVVVGTVVTVVTTLHVLMLVGPWLALIPIGILLLTLGATNERRRRTQERVRGALRGMR